MTPAPGGEPRERPARARPSLARAATTTYGTNLAVAVLSLVNVLIVARALGPVGRGDVAFLIAIATLTSHVGTLSVQEANANIAGAEPRLRPSLASNSVVLALVSGAATILVVGGLVAVFPSVGGEPERALLWLALASIPVHILRRYFTFLVQADYGFAVTNAAWLLGPVATSATNGLLYALGAISTATAITAWVGGQVLGTALLLAYVARGSGFGRPDVPLARRAVGFGLKAHIGRFMTLGNYRVDQWFLGAMSGSRELGLYSVAVAWAEVLFYLPAVLVMVQRPDLVRASREQAAVLAGRVFRVALLMAAALALLLVLAAPVLCVTVFGEEFRGSVDDLRVLALAAFGIVALELLGSALTAQRRPLRATAAIGVAFVVTIALDLILIPRYGGLGAAVATSVAWTLGGIAVALLFTRALSARISELVPRGTEVGWLWQALRARASSGTARDRR